MSDQEIVTVTIGNVGTGKSKFNSRLLGRENAFVSGSTMSAVTSSVSGVHGRFLGHGISIFAIDTPGLAESFQKDEEHLEALVKFIKMLKNGANVFLVVLKVTDIRFDMNIQRMFKILEEIFTPAVWNHVGFVFTHCDPGAESIWAEYKSELQRDFLRTVKSKFHNIPASAKLPLFFISSIPSAPSDQFRPILNFATQSGKFGAEQIQRIVHQTVAGGSQDEEMVDRIIKGVLTTVLLTVLGGGCTIL